MRKNRIFTLIRILLLALFFSAGCATVKKESVTVGESKVAQKVPVQTKEISVAATCPAAPAQPQPKFFDDVLTFTSLEEVDLDGDGSSEIIAVYISKSNVNSIKIIKLDAARKLGNVIFNRTFLSSVVKLSIKDNKPVLIVREVDGPSGRLINRTYYWDGKTFISE